MLRKAINLTLMGLIVGLVSLNASAAKPGGPDAGDDPYNGNGAPSGAHFTLNLIGKERSNPKDPEDTKQSNGKRIFVVYDGNTKILLTEGPFDVIDYDGTDGTAAFQLPNPDDDGGYCDGLTEYSVFARALGPSGSATMTTCAEDKATGNTTYCSTLSYVAVGGTGKKSFTNVSRELLYIYSAHEGSLKKYPLFGDSLYDYYWDYDNDELRLAQLRFYEISTDTDTYDSPPGSVPCDFYFGDDP